jgi:hypothetical protein
MRDLSSPLGCGCAIVLALNKRIIAGPDFLRRRLDWRETLLCHTLSALQSHFPNRVEVKSCPYNAIAKCEDERALRAWKMRWKSRRAEPPLLRPDLDAIYLAVK